MCFFGLGNLKAQSPVATLEHNDTTTVFYGINAFADAYTASQNGDLIFLSSGTFTSPTEIAKGIRVYGAGCYLDATSNETTTISPLYVLNGSDNFLLEGVICNTIYLYVCPISNLSIIRCKITDISAISNGSGYYSSILIENCIITGTITSSGLINNSIIRNNIFHNSILGYSVNGGSVIIFDNNVFISQYTTINQSDCYFKNNIFYTAYQYSFLSNIFTSYNNNCTYLNNLFCENSVLNYGPTNVNNTNYGNNILLANYYTFSIDSVFTSLLDVNNFSFQNDYHMKYPNLYKGADNTEVGVYGGTTAFKEKALPSNPHIVSKSIATQTDLNGNLPVNIKAKAQKY
jgi:hypothetical protein